MVIRAQDDSQQKAELRLAFLRHLPRRLEQMARRGRRFCRDGWDINGLSLLTDDVQRIGGTAGRCGALEVSQQLLGIEGVLAQFLAREELPDEAANSRLLVLFERLSPEATRPTALEPQPTIAAPAAVADNESRRVEAPPSHYWRRWSGDATPAQFGTNDPGLVPMTSGTARASDELPGFDYTPTSRPAPTPAPAATPASSAPAARPAAAPAAPQAPAPEAPLRQPQATQRPTQGRQASRTTSARIYHLSDGGPLALELDQRLEAQGYELELLDSSDELKEILTALAPDLVIVDAGFKGELESIGAVLRSTRERTGGRLALLALADEDSVPVRLSARRAGADALLVNPRGAGDVLLKVHDLLEASSESTYRILIVEDDRSQGLFAESILRNAGMEARVVSNAFEVLNAMDQFKPDLVLMDLYMPDCDGTELTALIRERDEFINTPIVFLSGESDVDKHYEALDAGGDDFLSKPIRPKHLISAVSNRVRRARTLQKRVTERNPLDAVTGLFTRAHALDRINEALGADDARDRPGGVLFLDLDGIGALREKIGLSGVEQLLSDAGTLVAKHITGDFYAARYGDGSFIVICPDCPDGALETLATDLRNLLVSHPFNIHGRPLRLRLSVGVVPFRLGFADAGSLLNTAERTSRDARALERGVLRFEPPKRAEDEQSAALTALIRNAVERDGFELLYQPIVAVQGGEESQYQTLLRLRDDHGRLHTAGEILPYAERADLMDDVDRWVLGQAMRTIEARRNDGMPIRLFVNQAAGTVALPDHAEWITNQLRARNLPGTHLVIELTLEDIESQVEAVGAFCQALVPAGVHFCLSRYESGAIGDSVLEKLPVDFLKLAPKYLGAAQTQSLRDDLRTIIDRAHRRGLMVIAQRVEDAQSAATLWMSGIDFIQGNLVQQAARELAFDFQAAVL